VISVLILISVCTVQAVFTMPVISKWSFGSLSDRTVEVCIARNVPETTFVTAR